MRSPVSGIGSLLFSVFLHISELLCNSGSTVVPTN